MNTHITAQGHFRLYGAVLAMAALLITLLAVTLTAGPTMAQADDGGPRMGDNADHYGTPLPCSEEVDPDANTAGIIRDGYHAVFDAFWDYEVAHLSNNFCPPKVEQTTKSGGLGGTTTIVNTRQGAHSHISKTVYSIPESYKVTVVDTRPGVINGTSSKVTGPTIDIADFPFLAESDAVSAVKTENDAPVFADNSLYWVRLDNPVIEEASNASPLQIGFSTGLLEEADWYLKDSPDDDDTKPEPPVQFRFAAVHVLQDGTPEEAHVLGAHFFAFDPGTSQTKALWSNVKTDTNSEVYMFTGEYRPTQLAFTKPGVYLVQAQAEGHVRKEKDRLDGAPKDWKPVNSDDTITSPVQWYTFHVGPEADLDVDLEAGAVETTGGVSTVPITVTAKNSGPNAAENVEVEINLPEGLSAPATLPSGATSSGCGVIAWKIGAMDAPQKPANPTDQVTPTTRTLTFNATVDPGAAGTVTATAEIRSTTFDPKATDNAASAEATLSGTNVRAPYFPGVSRTIVEHAVGGAHAGDPVAAVSPDGRALHYSLSGTCSNKFQVHPNGQIVLAAGHTLDYEEQWEYPLTLHVSDGVNASGNDDPAIDDSTPVLVQVQDTDPADHPTVTFKLTPHDSDVPVTGNPVADNRTYHLRATLHNAPAGATLTYDWDIEGWWNPRWDNRFHTNYYPAAESQPKSTTYIVHIKWPGGGISARHTLTFEAASP